MAIKLKEFYEQYYEDYQVRNTKESTVKTRHSVFKNHILPAIGNMALSNVFSSDIDAVYNDMETNGYKQNTIFGVYSALCSIFRLATEENFIAENPIRKARTIQPILRNNHRNHTQ